MLKSPLASVLDLGILMLHWLVDSQVFFKHFQRPKVLIRCALIVCPFGKMLLTYKSWHKPKFSKGCCPRKVELKVLAAAAAASAALCVVVSPTAKVQL